MTAAKRLLAVVKGRKWPVTGLNETWDDLMAVAGWCRPWWRQLVKRSARLAKWGWRNRKEIGYWLLQVVKESTVSGQDNTQ